MSREATKDVNSTLADFIANFFAIVDNKVVFRTAAQRFYDELVGEEQKEYPAHLLPGLDHVNNTDLQKFAVRFFLFKDVLLKRMQFEVKQGKADWEKQKSHVYKDLYREYKNYFDRCIKQTTPLLQSITTYLTTNLGQSFCEKAQAQSSQYIFGDISSDTVNANQENTTQLVDNLVGSILQEVESKEIKQVDGSAQEKEHNLFLEPEIKQEASKPLAANTLSDLLLQYCELAKEEQKHEFKNDGSEQEKIVKLVKAEITSGKINPFNNFELYKISMALIDAHENNNDKNCFHYWCLGYLEKNEPKPIDGLEEKLSPYRSEALDFSGVSSPPPVTCVVTEAQVCQVKCRKGCDQYDEKASKLVELESAVLKTIQQAKNHIKRSCKRTRLVQAQAVVYNVESKFKDFFKLVDKEQRKDVADSFVKNVDGIITDKQDILREHQNWFFKIIQLIKRAFVKPSKLTEGPGLFATKTAQEVCKVHDVAKAVAASAA